MSVMPLSSIPTPTPSLRITVVGAGAIGGALAVRLSLAGHRVSVLARGATLAALRDGPASLTDVDGTHRVHLPAYDSAYGASDALGGDVTRSAADVGTDDGAAAIGEQDLVILALKAHTLPAVAPALTALLGPQTRVMPAVNGVPWWYFQGLSQGAGVASAGSGAAVDATATAPIAALDPDGVLGRVLAPARIVGTVVYMTGHMPSAGVYVSNNPHRLILGEIDATTPAPGGSQHGMPLDAASLAGMFAAAGIAAQDSAAIRTDVWTKITGNLTSNPLSVLTGATLEQIYGDPTLLSTVRPMLAEVRRLTTALGVTLPFEDDAFLARCRGMGAVRTSMLQDAERGRPLELGAIGDAVLELAARADVAMPVTASIIGLVRHRTAARI